MKKKKKSKPPKPKKGATCSGTWQFRGEGPTIKFRASPERGTFAFPRTMSRKAWTAFFRFMLATFSHIRPQTLNDTLKEFVRERRSKRRRRRRRYRVRPNPPPKAPDPTTPPPEAPTVPGPDLMEAAKKKLEESP